jgi:hypothetical protein
VPRLIAGLFVLFVLALSVVGERVLEAVQRPARRRQRRRGESARDR